MIYYLMIGFGFYLSAALIRKESFKYASVSSIIRGLVIGIFLWPALVIMLLKDEL